MSLYNEERPKTLSEVRGQEMVKQQLQGMFLTGNIPNAMLLVGPRGTGKTTIARIIARRINCRKKTGNADCTCPSCMDAFSGMCADIVEMDAASNNKVEDVAKIVEQVQYAPSGLYQVYILDEVHMFSTGAWNALLKTIEEPPAHVLFILCTTEEQKVPATIISRCRKLYFEKIRLEEIFLTLREVTEKHGKAYEEDALKLIAKASDGCMRDALSILEGFFCQELTAETVSRTLGSCREDAVFDILSSVQKGDVSAALSSLRGVLAFGSSPSSVLKALMEAVSDAVFLCQGASPSEVIQTTAYRKRLQAFAGTVDALHCIGLSHRLSEVYGAISKASDASFLLENALIGMVQEQSEISLLKERLRALELGFVPPIAPAQTPQPQDDNAEGEPVTVTGCDGEDAQPGAAEVSIEEVPNAPVAQEDDADLCAAAFFFAEEEIPPLCDGILPTVEEPLPKTEVMDAAALLIKEAEENAKAALPPKEIIATTAEQDVMRLLEEDAKRREIEKDPSYKKPKTRIEQILGDDLVREMADNFGELPYFQNLLDAA